MTHIHPRRTGSTQIGRFARARAIGLACAIAATAGSAIALMPIVPFVGTACAGSGPNHAALVVQHGSGLTIQRCVAFSSATITGDQLLEMSGIEYATATFGGFGLAVCQVDSEPEHFAACLPPGPDPYWVVFVARGRGPWAVSNLGVSSQTYADGDAEGFRYDPQTGTAATPPVATPCPSPTPIPTTTATPISAARPHPTPRPLASGTSQPSSGTSSPLGAGPGLALPSESSPADPALVQSGSAPPADPAHASSNDGFATAAALLALLALALVAIAAARSRSRRAGR